MRFGRDHFAIQCDIRSADRYIIGDVWLWVKGSRIGDDTSVVDLPLVLANLAGPLLIRDRRHNAFFDSLNKDQIAAAFSEWVFSASPILGCDPEIVNLYRRHLLISAPDLEGFDSGLVLLIGTAGGDRLIWRLKDQLVANEITLKPGEYDRVVLSCLDWVETETGYRSPDRASLGVAIPGS